MFTTNVLLSCFLWAVACVSARISSGLTQDLHLQNSPGTTDADTLHALHHALKRDTVEKNVTSFEKSWDNAVLFKTTAIAGVKDGAKGSSMSFNLDVEVACTTCYAKGTITTELSASGDFNISQAFNEVKDEFGDTVKTLWDEATDMVTTFVSSLTGWVASQVDALFSGDQDYSDFVFPTMDMDLDVNITSIPEMGLKIRFDETELYVALATTLSGQATYTLHLYSSKTPVGFRLGDELGLGLVLNFDLILDVESELSINSGFHLLLDDGLELNINLFSDEPSDLDFPGGRFEFLPVTVVTKGATLRAILRIQIDLVLALSSPHYQVANETYAFGAGIEGSVFANLAEFGTTITTAEGGAEPGCELEVVEYFQFAVGAAAGVFINMGTEYWGVMPSTTTPIFYTTLAAVCAAQASAPNATTTSGSDATSSVALRGREPQITQGPSKSALSTTTLTSETTYIGRGCMLSGVVDCPVANQTTVSYKTTLTLVTAIPSGASDPTWPSSVFTTVASTIEFGENAKKISESSGTPTSYNPETSNTDSIASEFLNKETGGVPNKTILGVSLGLGLPAVLAIAGGCFFLWRRNQQRKVCHPAAKTEPEEDKAVQLTVVSRNETNQASD